MLNGAVVLEDCRLGFRQVAYAHSREWIGAVGGSFGQTFRAIPDRQFDALIRTADFFKKLATHAAALDPEGC
jgi:hypothetical protein